MIILWLVHDSFLPNPSQFSLIFDCAHSHISDVQTLCFFTDTIEWSMSLIVQAVFRPEFWVACEDKHEYSKKIVRWWFQLNCGRKGEWHTVTKPLTKWCTFCNPYLIGLQQILCASSWDRPGPKTPRVVLFYLEWPVFLFLVAKM
jgi:hypothetical protein